MKLSEMNDRANRVQLRPKLKFSAIFYFSPCWTHFLAQLKQRNKL